jgi:hypothetical protein
MLLIFEGLICRGYQVDTTGKGTIIRGFARRPLSEVTSMQRLS